MNHLEIPLKDWLDLVITEATSLESLNEAIAAAHVILMRQHPGAHITIPIAPDFDAQELYTWCEEMDIKTNRNELSPKPQASS